MGTNFDLYFDYYIFINYGLIVKTILIYVV